jgi:hypothetical protein
MVEFIVIVESCADAETATRLAERVLLEKVDWLELDLLQNLFGWSGLEMRTLCSCWKDIPSIIEQAKQSGLPFPKYLGHSRKGTLKADGAAAMKILNLIRLLQHKNSREIRAVLFIRDLDSQPDRKKGLERARAEDHDRQPPLKILIGTADRMREAWVLNGFEPLQPEERKILQEITAQLTFDPCKEAHRLRSNSRDDPDRMRNPKVILDLLTNHDQSREQQCWEKTDLNLLRTRGVETGLTDYLQEVEQRLVPILRDG